MYNRSSYYYWICPVGQSFSGREFDAMDEGAQAQACRDAKLFSRVEPAHKSKIVGYLQKDGAVSAMVSKPASIDPIGYSSKLAHLGA